MSTNSLDQNITPHDSGARKLWQIAWSRVSTQLINGIDASPDVAPA
jgi:hypothetical protein